jgi:hypothetical protein
MYNKIDEMPLVEKESYLLKLKENIIVRHLNNKEILEKEEANFLTRKVMLNILKDLEDFSFQISFQFSFYSLRDISKEEKLMELNEDINFFEKKYLGTFLEVFKGVTDNEADGMNCAIDYYDWKELIIERDALILLSTCSKFK